MRHLCTYSVKCVLFSWGDCTYKWVNTDFLGLNYRLSIWYCAVGSLKVFGKKKHGVLPKNGPAAVSSIGRPISYCLFKENEKKSFGINFGFPVAARSKAYICRRSPAEIRGSNPTGCMDVCLVWVLCVVRGLCDELMTRPEESYRLWWVVVCDLETSWMRRPWPTGGCRAK
jgi:hypothetical protein